MHREYILKNLRNLVRYANYLHFPLAMLSLSLYHIIITFSGRDFSYQVHILPSNFFLKKSVESLGSFSDVTSKNDRKRKSLCMERIQFLTWLYQIAARQETERNVDFALSNILLEPNLPIIVHAHTPHISFGIKI